MGLYCVLAVQAVLSLRLMWANTAFLDEATYLFAGHVELEHLLTGSSVPAYQTYFSGAPVVYPPLAALANDAGGLIGARLLSLAFMLGATTLLWGMTSRLAGKLAAFFAVALFVALGPTQYLGAFATYDAMALFFLTASAYCAVRAGELHDGRFLVLAASVLLAISNATKYATGLFDPVIIVLGAAAVAERRGLRAGLARGGFLAVTTLGIIGVALTLAGPLYLAGVTSTTLARPSGDTPAKVIVADSVSWVGVVVGLGVVGAVVCLVRGWLRKRRRARHGINFRIAPHGRTLPFTMTVLAVAGLLVTANQARIHTATSLSKHVDFGAWFAAAAGGALLAMVCHVFSRGRRRSRLAMAGTAFTALAVTAAVVAPLAVQGRKQGAEFYQAWPNATQLAKIVGNVASQHPGNILAEDYDVPAYYLEDKINWQRWSNTWYFTYWSSSSHRLLSGTAAWQAAVLNHYFSLIILDYGDTAGVDAKVVRAINQSGDYHVIAEAPDWDSFGTGEFTIWAYEPAKPAGSA